MQSNRCLLALLLVTCGQVAWADDSDSDKDAGWAYGGRGLEWSAPATGSYVWVGLRAQLRYTSIPGNLFYIEDYDDPEDGGGRVNRSRYKIGAGYRDQFTAYHEYDLRNSNLLDLRATWTPSPAFNLRAGQWKAEYNRERVDSSGKQQFVDRSISNYWFTVDRQWGTMASGRINEGSSTDSQWWAGVFGGNGRNEAVGDGPPMWVGRWQWNYTGRSVPFSQSALKRYEKPHGSLTFGGVVNDSPYTRYSSSGGGQLPGYPDVDDNRYQIRQLMQEWAFQHHGLNIQQELHWKSIEDRDTGATRDIVGGYVQAGWFPASRWQSLPEQWEVATRVGYVDPDLGGLENGEVAFATNWFFNGHRNKLTAEAAWLRTIDEDDSRAANDWRFSLQWEISI